MSRRGGGPRPRRRALLAVLAVVLGALLPGLHSRPAAALAPGDIEVDVVAIGPDVVAPGTTLTLTVVVTNSGDAPLVAPLVRLELAPRLLASRTAVADWSLAGDDEFSGSRVAETPVQAEIAPGAQVTVPLTVPADSLPLSASPSAWGPRGIAVSVLDAEFAQVALTRSHVVWFPGRSFASPIRTSVLVPVTAGAPDVATGLVPGEELEALTADGGRLASVLGAASTPGVTWALDPALLSSAAALEDPAPGDPAGVPASSFLGRLRQAAVGREVLALPYADPDLTAVAHSGQEQLHALAEEQGRDVVQQLLGQPARTDVAWPASGSVDPVTLEMLADDGRSAVVLSQGAQPLAESLSFTPTGRSTLTAGENAVAGLLVDTPLSTTLAGIGSDGGADGGPSQVADDVLAVQRLLAETAAITMERPSVDRHVLVTAPRDWDPDSRAGARALTTLTAVPWVQAHPVGDLLDTEAPDIERAPLSYPASDADGELPAEGLDEAGAALAAARRMAPALSRPEDLLATAERSAVAATSVAWRSDLRAWATQVNALTETSSALTSGVRVVPGSAINVLSARADLPLTVSNTLDQAVQVELSLNPTSSRLVAENGVDVALAAGSQERVSVPVRALASGDTQVRVQVLTPAGEPIGDAVTLTVRVRADWESRGTLAVAALTGLLFVVGIIRTIRRGRRPVGAPPTASPPDTP